MTIKPEQTSEEITIHDVGDYNPRGVMIPLFNYASGDCIHYGSAIYRPTGKREIVDYYHTVVYLEDGPDEAQIWCHDKGGFLFYCS